MDMKIFKKIIKILAVTIIVFYFVICCTARNNQEKEINYQITKLRSKISMIRKEAVNEIPKYGNKAVNPLSDLLLEDHNEEVLKDVIQSLGQIRTEEAALVLIQFFQHTHQMPNEVTDALSAIGQPAVQPLLNEFNNSDSFTKEVILGSLNNLLNILLADHKAIEQIKKLYLRAALNDDSIRVRKTALILLGQSLFLEDPKIKSVIRNALKSENGDIRVTAFIVLTRGSKIYPDKNEIDRIVGTIKDLEHYYASHQIFPQNLNVFVKEGIMEQACLLNPWGYPYIYEVAKDGKSFKFISVGKDGGKNTDDDTVFTWVGE